MCLRLGTGFGCGYGVCLLPTLSTPCICWIQLALNHHERVNDMCCINSCPVLFDCVFHKVGVPTMAIVTSRYVCYTRLWCYKHYLTFHCKLANVATPRYVLYRHKHSVSINWHSVLIGFLPCSEYAQQDRTANPQKSWPCSVLVVHQCKHSWTFHDW